ncbi:MAG: CBS domain-containing protein [Candidatus Woesearchaeota archaeon]
MQNVGDWMIKDVLTVKEDEPLIEAARRIVEKNVAALPVLNSKGEYAGIVFERSILKHAVIDKKGLEGLKVSDVLIRDYLTLEPTTNIFEALRVMDKEGVQRIPVVENSKLVGFVSIKDILRKLISL